MKKERFLLLMRSAALFGNVLFILWATANGVKEGFNGTIFEKMSYAVLIILLATNIFFLTTDRLKKQQPSS